MSAAVSVRLGIEGSLVQDSPEVLCCVIQQDTLSSALSSLVMAWFNPGTQETSRHDYKIVEWDVKVNVTKL